jgi:hypothetical protein
MDCPLPSACSSLPPPPHCALLSHGPARALGAGVYTGGKYEDPTLVGIGMLGEGVTDPAMVTVVMDHLFKPATSFVVREYLEGAQLPPPVFHGMDKVVVASAALAHD